MAHADSIYTGTGSSTPLGGLAKYNAMLEAAAARAEALKGPQPKVLSLRAQHSVAEKPPGGPYTEAEISTRMLDYVPPSERLATQERIDAFVGMDLRAVDARLARLHNQLRRYVYSSQDAATVVALAKDATSALGELLKRDPGLRRQVDTGAMFDALAANPATAFTSLRVCMDAIQATVRDPNHELLAPQAYEVLERAFADGSRERSAADQDEDVADYTDRQRG